MKAVVTGMIATYPVGGVVWDYGQYLLGLERLGFEVYYLEDTGGPTYNPTVRDYGEDPSFGLQYLQDALTGLSPGLKNRWHFRDQSGATYGIEAERLRQIMSEADLFLNVSGGTLLRDEYMKCARKVLIDSDPGWNHFVNYPKWDRGEGWPGTYGFRGHDYFFTYAERLGEPDCILPDFGLTWHPTRPVVVPECWSPCGRGQRWTTVMTWDNFRRPILYEGRAFGTKELEFPRIANLPRRVKVELEIGAGGGTAPVDEWRAAGWHVLDSHSVSETPGAYRDYICQSRGELSVAKNVYVATRSGWFSCRSVCYLAAGRPAVLQDTGFSERIETGRGLFAFDDLESAAAALETVEANSALHQEAAAEIGREVFGYEKVLGQLLSDMGLG